VSRLQDVLSEENRRKIDLSSVSFGASSDAKISIRKFESVGVFSSFSMTFSLDAFTGELPVDELLNEIVIPLRESFTNFAHPATMATVEELRAVIEGINAGKSTSEIEADVQKVKKGIGSLYAKALGTSSE